MSRKEGSEVLGVVIFRATDVTERAVSEMEHSGVASQAHGMGVEVAS